jgi:hypothetical protein
VSLELREVFKRIFCNFLPEISTPSASTSTGFDEGQPMAAGQGERGDAGWTAKEPLVFWTSFRQIARESMFPVSVPRPRVRPRGQWKIHGT